MVVAAQCASRREPVFLPGHQLNRPRRWSVFSHVILFLSGWPSAWPVAGDFGKATLAVLIAVGATGLAAHALTTAAAGLGCRRRASPMPGLAVTTLSFDDIDRNYMWSRRYSGLP